MLATYPSHIPQDPQLIIAEDLSTVHARLKQFKRDQSHTLVAFDVDMTLTVAKHPAFYFPNLKQHEVRWKQLFEGMSKAEIEQVVTWAIHHNEQALIEPHAPTIIQGLQTQGFKTIGLTALLTGRLISRESLEVRRFQRLQALGIDFQQAFAEKNFKLKDIAKHNGHYPVYYKGILYSNGEQGLHNKGTVLISFLKKVSFRPKLVMMIDDRSYNLTDIKEALAEFDASIEFLGVEYVGGKSYGSEEIEEADFVAFWQSHIDQIKKRIGYDSYQKTKQ